MFCITREMRLIQAVTASPINAETPRRLYRNMDPITISIGASIKKIGIRENDETKLISNLTYKTEVMIREVCNPIHVGCHQGHNLSFAREILFVGGTSCLGVISLGGPNVCFYW